MPNLKSLLMDHGTTFENGFVHTPICCPSRSSILTGKYLHNIRVINNTFEGNCDGTDWQDTSEKQTFAVYAKFAGYQTGYAGKYLNTYVQKKVPPGWDRWLGLVGNSAYYGYSLIQSNNAGVTTKIIKHKSLYSKDYLPDVVINRTLDSIDNFTALANAPPFLLVSAFPTPHGPFTPAPQDMNHFKGLKALRTPNWNSSLESVLRKHWFVSTLAPIDPKTEARIDHVYQLREEALLSVDRHIQLIVQKLKAKGILDNTIIIYSSDNGFNMGQHRVTGDKRQPYEHDIRVPFIVRGPGFPAKTVSTRIVMNVDIAPTILDLVSGGGGQNSGNEGMDGISFAPCDKNSSYFINCLLETNARKDFLVTYHGEGYRPCGFFEGCPVPKIRHDGDCLNNTFNCLRTLDLTENTIYCEFQDDVGFIEFYDMKTDQWQLDNLYPKKMNTCQLQRYQKRLAQLRTCKGSTCRQAAAAPIQPKSCHPVTAAPRKALPRSPPVKASTKAPTQRRKNIPV